MRRIVPLVIAGLSLVGSAELLQNSLSEANVDDAASWTNETRILSEETSELLSDTGRTLKQKKKEKKKNERKNEKKKKNEKSQSPNVLIITTDQHRFDALQFVQEEMLEYVGKTKV
jgi:hypothetical protein